MAADRCKSTGVDSLRLGVKKSQLLGAAQMDDAQKEKDPWFCNHGSGSGYRSVGLWGGEQPLKRINVFYVQTIHRRGWRVESDRRKIK